MEINKNHEYTFHDENLKIHECYLKIECTFQSQIIDVKTTYK